ncbi:Pycsar system effector family protein [Legionella micdadei]|uniref:Pycsar effector protein domain-containing protein n=1 Tax=Legionella micdadei TaxID=451 RepID=A0A098GFG1_LEGMI|nr:Pycsar system effector family protein [Legionella micdadei]ARG99991.1 hypothetical protein B6V88_05940 [Legionella micdadei]KTD27787.1 hypothetical protein Lmic_2107 [Legionella micdadei]NSL17772.1 hypothetical protein [Legionella micdadei]CEG60725.1 membrane protein of unknown function [Legionella micdadei]SCY11291.1 hypothetical protein SAMN02982997_00842 [Legionella micdadei]
MDKITNSGDRMHFLRCILQNNIQHISIADNKAGVLLGANFILLSILVGELRKGLHLFLLIPIIFSFIIVIFAVRTLSPKLIFSAQIPRNLIFFGEVIHHEFDSYVQNAQTILSNSELIYKAMLNDFYQSSLILNKKYANLRVCYRLCYVFFLSALLITFYMSLKLFFS